MIDIISLVSGINLNSYQEMSNVNKHTKALNRFLIVASCIYYFGVIPIFIVPWCFEHNVIFPNLRDSLGDYIALWFFVTLFWAIFNFFFCGFITLAGNIFNWCYGDDE